MQLTVISVMSFAKEPQKPRPLLRQLMRALYFSPEILVLHKVTNMLLFAHGMEH